MDRTIRARGASEMVATVPHLMGFFPNDSVVCIALDNGGPTARIDHPHTPQELTDVVEVLADCYSRHWAPGLAILAYTDDETAARETVTALTRALQDHQRIRSTLWVDKQSWTELRTGERGTVDAEVSLKMDAEAVALGMAKPVASRDELARTLSGNPRPVAEHLPSARAHTASLDSAGTQAEHAWIKGVVEGFRETFLPLPDPHAARLLSDMENTELRDDLVLGIRREDAESHRAMWQDLTKRAPSEVRTPAATLLAFSSWLAGNGAQSWVALDLVEDREQYPLAGLVSIALNKAVSPTVWDNRSSAATQTSMQRAALSNDPTTRPGRAGPHRDSGRGAPRPEAGGHDR